jgi:hypothetical protein
MSVHEVNRSVDALTYAARCAWLELNARCTEARVWIVLLETLRTPERLEWLIEHGKSWSHLSYHLPSEEDGKAAAFDAAPIVSLSSSILRVINWDPDHRHWGIYVDIGVKLGLESGANWSQKDWSHMQLQRRR